jgi:hypothetical protein
MIYTHTHTQAMQQVGDVFRIVGGERVKGTKLKKKGRD